jgi:signal transduction histidine kinase
MKNRSEPEESWDTQLERIIGLGERSYRKSYYPELQHKLLELEEKNAELEAKNAELEQFAYTVSHDLKTPLITIRGFLGILQEAIDHQDREEIDEACSRIARATEAMAKLLNHLLELSRIGRLVNPPEHVPFAQIVEEAIQRVAGRIAEAHAKVHVEPSLPTIFGDRDRLVEVMQNLIDNAVKYSCHQPQSHVDIGGRKEGGKAVLYVRDNGIGIENRFHERVFELFRQLDRNSPGTGIGLALVKRIIEVHGGRIWVESDGLGAGATFRFTIPDPSSDDPPEAGG